jgi:hypothetical protein
MRGKTSLTVENNDCIEEALKEAMPNAEILKNEIMQAGRRERCEYVIRRARQYDIGLKAKSDGTYEILGYNPGYGRNRQQVSQIMSPVYTAYIKTVVKKALSKNPQLADMKMDGEVKDAITEINGKKKKVKHIRLTGGYVGGSDGSTSGGWV